MTILYGAGISNSTRHLGVNLPLVLLGGGAGRLKGGRHLRYPGDTSNADLLMTLMDKLDMPLDRLGDSTKRLPDRHAVGGVSMKRFVWGAGALIALFVLSAAPAAQGRYRVFVAPIADFALGDDGPTRHEYGDAFPAPGVQRNRPGRPGRISRTSRSGSSSRDRTTCCSGMRKAI